MLNLRFLEGSKWRFSSLGGALAQEERSEPISNWMLNWARLREMHGVRRVEN
jgi:hypothetical protein